MANASPELLTRLLEEHQRVLTLYARQWCDAAEDVVQDAFLQLVRQRSLPERVVPWLYRVVRNGAISAGRCARRREHYEHAAAEGREGWFCHDATSELDAAAAQAALAGLPAEQRETVVARLWGGLLFEEVAELMGTSTSSAHRHYHAALAALREKLEMDSCRPRLKAR